jgi:hypothetical protein
MNAATTLEEPATLSHGDHEAAGAYPEDPTTSCRCIGFNLWSCGWSDDAWRDDNLANLGLPPEPRASQEAL